MLLFVLPLLDVTRVRRALALLLPRLPSPSALVASAAAGQRLKAVGDGEGGGAAGDGGEEGGGSGAWAGGANAAGPRLNSSCPMCGSTDILIPFEAQPCRHIFCYYCLRSNCEADGGFCCPLDGKHVVALQRRIDAG